MAQPTGRRPNQYELYKSPLPVNIRPHPPLIPHNPLSWVYYVIDLYFPPPVEEVCVKGFVTDDNVVEISDEKAMITLWKMGFFGKGTLSRSEPTWLGRYSRRLGLQTDIPLSSEEITKIRRQERQRFKEERAKADLEILERRRKLDAGEKVEGEVILPQRPMEFFDNETIIKNTKQVDVSDWRQEDVDVTVDKQSVIQQEVLELMPTEALFLALNFDCLEITKVDSIVPLTTSDLFLQFISNLKPDDEFLLDYIAYHHYRSLGWCVRSGIKFGVSYLIYKKGPPFAHAEFAIMILPSYKDELKNLEIAKPWWWTSSVNRVIGGVKKNMIFCYIEVPNDISCFIKDGIVDFKKLLTSYKIKEVVYRRWVPNRNRD